MNSIKFDLRTNMLIVATLLITADCLNARSKSAAQTKPNTLTKKEIALGFRLLFEGTADSMQKNFKGVTDDKKSSAPPG